MGKPSQDTKRHFKMYKKGKLWLVAGITAASLFAGVHGAKADTVNQVAQADKVTTTTGNANSSDNDTQVAANSSASQSATVASDSAVLTSTAAPSAVANSAVATSASVQSASSAVIQEVATAAKTVAYQATPASSATNSASAQASAASQASVDTAQYKAANNYATKATAAASATAQNKEVYSGGHWYLQSANGSYLNGWQSLSGNRVVYYDTATNQMQYGEKKVGNQWYFLDTVNGDVQTGWYKLADGRTVYYDVKKGANSVSGQGMLHGMRKTASGSYYYFNQSTGAEETGFKKVDGKTYYFAPSRVQNSEKQIDGSWYYFGSDGAMATGFTTLPDGRVVYYNARGQMQHNEQKLNSHWYYFDVNMGTMATGFTTLPDGRTVYYDLKSDGSGQGMLHGIQTLSNGKIYYFDNNLGTEYKNYIYYNATAGKLQYFTKDGSMAKSTTVNLGSKYVVDDKGYLQLKNGENELNGNWYLYDATVGKVKVGWQTLAEGRKVYYDTTTATMKHGEAKINGQWYYFDKVNGKMATGLTKLPDGRTVYYNTQGQMQYGEQVVNGHWHYFDKVNGAMTTGFAKLSDGRTVYYNGSGEMLYGWQTINGNTYYFDKVNGKMATGTVSIDGKTYSFNSDGVEEAWGWPFPNIGQGHFTGGQLFGVNAGGEFRRNGFHNGLDFGSVDHPGSTVHAVHAGTVASIGYMSGMKWYVTVDTGKYLVVYQEAFATRSQIAVSVGQKVGLGDVIGYRNTSHLHLGITWQKNLYAAVASTFINNGTWLNPLTIIANNG